MPLIDSRGKLFGMVNVLDGLIITTTVLSVLGVAAVKSGATSLSKIVEKEGPINVSNVMLLDPKGNKGTRIGVRRTDDGKRVRIARRSGAEVD